MSYFRFEGSDQTTQRVRYAKDRQILGHVEVKTGTEYKVSVPW